MNNSFRLLPYLALLGAALSACDGSESGSSDSPDAAVSGTVSGTTSNTATGPTSTNTGVPTGTAGNDDTSGPGADTSDDNTDPAGPGNSDTPDPANDAACPDAQPNFGEMCDTTIGDCGYGDATCTCQAGFGGGGFGGGNDTEDTAQGVWFCNGGMNTPGAPDSDAGAGPAAPMECPAAEPADGDDCAVPANDECNYGATTCTCPFGGGGFGGGFGGGGATRSWDCGATEEPDMSDPGTPDQGDGGLMTECPERSPRDGAGCNVVATAMCTYDTQECTCDQAQGGGFGGGFGGGGGDETVWNCDQLGGDPAGPSDAGATPSCPVAAPEEGGDCDLPRETACEYGAQSCSCGGPPNNRNWGCEGGETPPANEDASVPGPLEPTPFGDDGGSSTDAG